MEAHRVLMAPPRLMLALGAWSVLLAVAVGLAAPWWHAAYPGFWVQPLGYVSPLLPEPRPELRSLDRLLSYDGRPYDTPQAFYRDIRALGPGRPVTYVFARADARVKVTIPTRTFTRALMARTLGLWLAIATLLAVAGSLVWLYRARSLPALAFGLVVTPLAFTLGLYFDFNTGAALRDLYLVTYPLTGLGLACLALSFPEPNAARMRRWGPFLLVPALLLAGALVLGTPREGLSALSAARYGASLGVHLATDVWMALTVLAALLAISWRTFGRNRPAAARWQARLAAMGTALGFLPFFLWKASYLPGRTPWVSLEVAMASVLLFPLAIAYALVRARLFAITALGRGFLIYGALVTLGTLMCAQLAMLLTATLPQLSLPDRRLLIVGLLTLLLVPLRDGLKALAARATGHAPAHVPRLLARAAEGLAQAGAPEDVERTLAEASARLGASEAALLPPAPTPGWIAPAAAPAYVGRDPAMTFQADGAQRLWWPLRAGGRCLGVWAIGPRPNGRPYDDHDMRAFAAVAAPAALALAQIQAREALARANAELEARVAERTADLESAMRELREAQSWLIESARLQTKQLLIAEVAHALNTPLTLARSGVELLEPEPLAVHDAFGLLRHGVESLEAQIGGLIALTREFPPALAGPTEPQDAREPMEVRHAARPGR